MLIHLLDKNCAKILLFLAISPGSKYTRNELKIRTKMNNIPLDIALNRLYSFNLIVRTDKIYSLNLESQILKFFLEERKKLSNLPVKIQFIILEAVDIISRFKNIKQIILFGSYSKLIFHENSDIDLAIILDDAVKSTMDFERAIFPFLNKLSKKFKKEIEAHYFIESDLKHKEDPLIKDIVRNGIKLL